MSEQSVVGRSNLTLPNEREIRVERVFDAPPERVFAAYTDPEQIPQWWGPHGTTTIVEEFEPRTGGRWQFRSRDSDGGEIVFRGYFREVEAPTRISQTFEWDGMPGYVSVDTAVFEPFGEGQTRIVTTSIFYTAEERDGMIESGMEKGMNETYDRLDQLLAQG
ncbi:MAG TPA: SRPBCC family protein [Solirubrobacterales bacterium]|nr:SRPBCC family protein [Solirubrobacterales bacterium]